MIDTKLIERYFVGSSEELHILKVESSEPRSDDSRHYYEIIYNEHFMFCPLILIEELDFVLRMALRATEDVKIKLSVSVISGIDTYVTTKLL